ncbi:uncharacterized protein BO95DRAFT_20340 [Aspergillus brunneoviolaceus CBS 621.78]|uniref:Uncharacterized protein n=1 Tax=Aspergillus brunneoviolaceus CBS 621.78 TaxID=1450534 RepID=A0ACD1FTM5_9EURO|nr:hypothetical protein BO95DRAFT_20340 [Aspergillus brunneoviolaceus CBS 621.78]RAH40323.1 hypothetical protein BO95DRAFT_20340 [Aspergillus brunneoviolaceus CBS 621.78]
MSIPPKKASASAGVIWAEPIKASAPFSILHSPFFLLRSRLPFTNQVHVLLLLLYVQSLNVACQTTTIPCNYPISLLLSACCSEKLRGSCCNRDFRLVAWN